MSNHLNVFNQKGCIDCKSCERGAAHIGRMVTLWTIGLFTAGIGLIFLPFFKKCQYCGHNQWWNKHYGPDMRASAQSVASQAS